MSNMKKRSEAALDVPESISLPPELVKLAERYSRALARRFPKDSQVKVLLRLEHGQALLDIEGVPVEQMQLVAEMLSLRLPRPSDALGPQRPLPVRLS